MTKQKPSRNDLLLQLELLKQKIANFERHSKISNVDNDKYQRLFELSSDPVLILEDDIFVECNNAAIDFLKYESKDEIIGKHPWELSPEFQPDGKNSKKAAVEKIEKASNVGYHRFEWVHYDKDKTEFWLDIALTLIENSEGKKQFYTVWRDITKAHHNKQELINSKEKYKELFEAESDAIFLIRNADGQILEANKAASQLYGYTTSEFKNLKNTDLSAQANETRTITTQTPVVKEDIVYIPLRYHKKKDGSELIVEITGRFFNFNNESVHIAAIRDITTRIAAEQELVNAKQKAEESDRLKSAFLANMSHEIRTPMNGILGFAEILKDPELTTEEKHDYLEIIERSGNRLLIIINDLIDISKIESNQMTIKSSETNINNQIMYIYNFFKPEVETKNIQLNYMLGWSDAKATINTDKEKLYAILTNLMKNAIKYSREGKIDFGYKCIDNQMVEFFVKDTGIGIPQKNIDSIFERFIRSEEVSSRDYEGAGLGLAITKAYVEMLGGDIWVESKEGIGSTFRFTVSCKLNQ